MSRRTERLGSTIQQELANMILRDLDDPRVRPLTSITRVKISEDLSTADVFITVMGTPGQQTAALNALKHAAGMMRVKLTKQMTLRIAPFLKFHIDEDLKKELQLQELLLKVRQENEELDRKRAAEGETTTGGGDAETGGEDQTKPGEPGRGTEEHDLHQ